MRGLRVAALVAAAFFVIGAGTASAANHMSASGSGVVVNGVGESDFSFTADGTGPLATGRITVVNRGNTISGTVVCLGVAGDGHAEIIALIDSSTLTSGVAAVGNYITAEFSANSFIALYGGAFPNVCIPSVESIETPLTAGQITLAGGDGTAPVVTPTIDGTLGNDGWYTSDVGVRWNVEEPDSWIAFQSGCGPADVTADTAGTKLSCFARSVGGITFPSLTIKRDATPPTVSYSGNAGLYSVADTVDIHCAASDALSGVASTTCADAAGPAWQFGLGATTLSATATDVAGNPGAGSTSFTVTVDAASLETLIARLVGDTDVASSLQGKVAAIGAAPDATAKAGKLAAFDHQIDAQTGKAVDASTAALLEQLAAAL